MKEMKPISNVKFVKKDFLQEESQNFIFSYFREKIDVIISDMAADTTGNKDLGQHKNKFNMSRST